MLAADRREEDVMTVVFVDCPDALRRAWGTAALERLR